MSNLTPENEYKGFPCVGCAHRKERILLDDETSEQIDSYFYCTEARPFFAMDNICPDFRSDVEFEFIEKTKPEPEKEPANKIYLVLSNSVGTEFGNKEEAIKYAKKLTNENDKTYVVVEVIGETETSVSFREY